MKIHISTIYLLLFCSTMLLSADEDHPHPLFSWQTSAAKDQTIHPDNDEITAQSLREQRLIQLTEQQINPTSKLRFPRANQSDLIVTIQQYEKLAQLPNNTDYIATGNTDTTDKSAEFTWICVNDRILGALIDQEENCEYRISWSDSVKSYIYREIDLSLLPDYGECASEYLDFLPISASTDKTNIKISSAQISTSLTVLYNSMLNFYQDLTNIATINSASSINSGDKSPTSPQYQATEDQSITYIDVLFVVTTAAQLQLNERFGSMELANQRQVAVMNNAFVNSNIHDIKIRYLGSRCIDYNETGKYFEQHLSALSGIETRIPVRAADLKLFKPVRTSWRDAVAADLVSLIVASSLDSSIGVTWTKPGDVDTAFSVILAPYATDNYHMSSFAHEAGHNFGCQHATSEFQDNSPGTDLYANGYAWQNFHLPDSFDLQWYASIMTYNYSSKHHRYYSQYPAYSSPDAYHVKSANSVRLAIPIGDSGHDNAAKIRQTAGILANYREQSDNFVVSCELRSDIAVRGEMLQSGQSNYYFIDVPQNCRQFTINLSAAGSDLDLYVNTPSYAVYPTLQSYRLSSRKSSSNEKITIYNPVVGCYRIMVYAKELTGTVVSYEIKAAYVSNDLTAQNLELKNGQVYQSDITSQQYINRYVYVPAATKKLQIRCWGEDNVQIYVNRPTRPDYPTSTSCTYATTKLTNNQSISIRNPAAGYWRISFLTGDFLEKSQYYNFSAVLE